MSEIPVVLGLQQRVLPDYRAPFFDLLAASCPKGLGVFAGEPRSKEAIATTKVLEKATFFPAKNIHIPVRSSYVLFQRGFTSWLQIWQPQALIVEANARYLSTTNAVSWMRKQHRPVIGWGLGAPKTNSKIEASLRSSFLNALDAVIAYSHTGAEQYIAAGMPAERVFVAPNAVAARPTTPPHKRPARFVNDRATLLFVGRLQARKKLDVLIEACSYLPKVVQPRLIIVGEGPELDSLQQLAARLYPQTEFPGAKHGTELEPYFAAADLFVLPGTGGLAVQQAMAHSLPVIVGEADGTQSELVRPENGWIVPEVYVPSLMDAIDVALQSPTRLRQMGEASYRIVSEEVNLEAMVETFVTAVNYALNHFRKPFEA